MRAAALVLLAAGAAAQADFASSLVEVAAPTTRYALRDMDGDGRRDLLAIGLDGLALRRLREDGTFPAADEGTLPWPAETVGWSLADLEGDGRTEVLLLVEGRTVLAVRAGADGVLATGEPLLEQPGGFLPRGIRRVNVVRDVDGDGRPDLVLPGNGRFLIHLNRPDGLQPAIPVAFRAEIGLELGDPSRLDGRFGQDVQIPWFQLLDVDGDGDTDLVSQTGDQAQVHLAAPDLPQQPSWTLDLAALRAEQPARGKVDLDNLLGNIEPQVNWRTADLDGEPPHDLVLQTGGTFRVYAGGSTGPALDAPTQVLKASGNVLYFLLRDTDGDARPELQILRAGTVSLGDALRLLVFPGSLDFDVFTYRAVWGTAEAERGEVFARRPTTRTTVALRIPALLGFLDDVEELQGQYEERLLVPAVNACLHGDGAFDDVVDVRGDELAFWNAAVPDRFGTGIAARLRSFDADELLELYVERELDSLGDGGRKEISLEDIRKLLDTPGWDLRQAVTGREPDATLALALPGDGARLRVEDLDGDGRSDLVVIGKAGGEGPRRLQFLVRR
jgi:hypothetical protein